MTPEEPVREALPSDETLLAILTTFYGRPYPAGDNVAQDMKDARKVYAIAARAALAETEGKKDSAQAPRGGSKTPEGR